MVRHLNEQNPLTNAIKGTVSRYVDCYGRVQLYLVVHFMFDVRYKLIVDEMARSSAVRSHGEIDGLRGDVDRRCGDDRITYTNGK